MKFSFTPTSKIFIGINYPWKSLIFADLNLGSVRWEDLSSLQRTGSMGAQAFQGEALTNRIPKAFGMVLLDQAKRTKKNINANYLEIS